MADCQWEQLWLPLYPLASDDLYSGIYRMNRSSALACRYIEANPHAVSNLLVVDIDHDDATLRAIWARPNWLPNAVVENPINGHAHAVWALAEPVTRTEYARRKPIALAAAVTEGLRRSVDGDKGYSGLITKNPVHESWNGLWFRDELYSLRELEGRLTEAGFMPPPSWKRTKRRNTVGLGRNCSIFETARTWAYPKVRNYRDRSKSSSERFLSEICSTVCSLNSEFVEPLPLNEWKAIASSIHRWITTKSRMWLDGAAVYEANLTLIQSARGKKSVIARRRKTASLVDELKKLEGEL